MSSPRIQNGGGSVPSGASYRRLSVISALNSSSKPAATANPTIGENRRDLPMLAACPQSAPLVPVFAFISWLAKPTPMIEPISVCELDAGNPRYQVPRFQMIAEMSRAKTMAHPAPDPTLITNSTGRSATMLNATAPADTMTPARFQRPDQTTATLGLSVWV